MYLTQDKLDRLMRLFSYESFTWEELRSIVRTDAQCVKFLNEQYEKEGPHAQLRQPVGENGEIPDNAIWDGMFALLDGMPVYVGMDGPNGGSGSPVGRYMHIWPDSVIEMI